MYWQHPVGLRGPVTFARAWWQIPAVRSKTVVLEETIRADLVARVRQEIADGRYDTPEKWDAALNLLLTRMA